MRAVFQGVSLTTALLIATLAPLARAQGTPEKGTPDSAAPEPSDAPAGDKPSPAGETPSEPPKDTAPSDSPPEEPAPTEEPPAEEPAAEEEEAASLSFKYGLTVQPDLRFRLEDKGVGTGFYDRRAVPAGIERNQNLLRGKLKASWGRFAAVAQVDFVLYGFGPEVKDISGLSRAEQTQPYRFDINNLYVEVKDLFVKGLDLRVGQRVIQWGEGDQFNPTNNINPDDLRDPLLFGRQAGNFMVTADYWLGDRLNFTGVLVPIFQPAYLPFTAPLATAALDRLPFSDEALRLRVASETAGSRGSLIGYPTVIGSVTPEMPEPKFENMQAAFRMALSVAEQDLSLSYYNGRTDFPQPKSNHTTQIVGPTCNPDLEGECVAGLLRTDVKLHYPRMHVYGFNMAGEINPFKLFYDKATGFGYRIEAALIVPERSTIKLTNDKLDLGDIVQIAGEYDYDNDGSPGGPEPEVVPRTPFLKWTVGLDTSVGEHLYLNGQWVHGLPDEYGAGDFIHPGSMVREGSARQLTPNGEIATPDETTLLDCAIPRDGTTCIKEVTRARIGDYAVIGADLKFLNDNLLLRVFTIFDVTGYEMSIYDTTAKARVKRSYSLFSEEGFSGVIYPEINYKFGNGLDLSAGALFLLGKPYTKFGDAAAGGSVAWLRARYSL